jgi:hypothetical protein
MRQGFKLLVVEFHWSSASWNFRRYAGIMRRAGVRHCQEMVRARAGFAAIGWAKVFAVVARPYGEKTSII